MMPGPRIAGAPISWGVCEVPGWGPMLPAGRVLRELTSLGLHAIELGAPGFLPTTAKGVRALLGEHGVELIGGFVPIVMQTRAVREANLQLARETAEFLSAAGGGHFVSALVVDPGWGARHELSTDEWSHVFDMLGEVDAICTDHGLVQVVHPHVNTLIEQAPEVQRVIDNSPTMLCLDTGHLAIGGFDPVLLSHAYTDRVGLVHMKDVNSALAERLNAGELTLMGATLEGMFRPLGNGDIELGAVVRNLLSAGYDGWFVLEQDTSLTGETPAEGCGPVEDVAISLAYLRREIEAFGPLVTGI